MYCLHLLKWENIGHACVFLSTMVFRNSERIWDPEWCENTLLEDRLRAAFGQFQPFQRWDGLNWFFVDLQSREMRLQRNWETRPIILLIFSNLHFIRKSVWATRCSEALFWTKKMFKKFMSRASLMEWSFDALTMIFEQNWVPQLPSVLPCMQKIEWKKSTSHEVPELSWTGLSNRNEGPKFLTFLLKQSSVEGRHISAEKCGNLKRRLFFGNLSVHNIYIGRDSIKWANETQKSESLKVGMQNNAHNSQITEADFDTQNFRVVKLRVLSHLCLQRMRRPH